MKLIVPIIFISSIVYANPHCKSLLPYNLSSFHSFNILETPLAKIKSFYGPSTIIHEVTPEHPTASCESCNKNLCYKSSDSSFVAIFSTGPMGGFKRLTHYTISYDTENKKYDHCAVSPKLHKSHLPKFLEDRSVKNIYTKLGPQKKRQNRTSLISMKTLMLRKVPLPMTIEWFNGVSMQQ